MSPAPQSLFLQAHAPGSLQAIDLKMAGRVCFERARLYSLLKKAVILF